MGHQQWEIVGRRLNAVLDQAPLHPRDMEDVMEDKKASMLLCFAISSQAPTAIIQLLIECNPTLLLRNTTPLRVATATKVSKQSMAALVEARSAHKPRTPSPSVAKSLEQRFGLAV